MRNEELSAERQLSFFVLDSPFFIRLFVSGRVPGIPVDLRRCVE
jgi:hypothetical protein